MSQLIVELIVGFFYSIDLLLLMQHLYWTREQNEKLELLN